jgi:Short C-terminal domain
MLRRLKPLVHYCVERQRTSATALETAIAERRDGVRASIMTTKRQGLTALRDAGLITEEEFAAKRTALIAEL